MCEEEKKIKAGKIYTPGDPELVKSGATVPLPSRPSITCSHVMDGRDGMGMIDPKLSSSGMILRLFRIEV